MLICFFSARPGDAGHVDQHEDAREGAREEDDGTPAFAATYKVI